MIAAVGSFCGCSGNTPKVVPDAGSFDLAGRLANPDAGRSDTATDTSLDIPADTLSPDTALPDSSGDPLSSLGPHCASLPETCGPHRNENCCTSLIVPGGTFYRSYDGSQPYNKTTYPATVSTFYLDKYEVTVARYRSFGMSKYGTQFAAPASGAGAHPKIPGSGWNSKWNYDLPFQPMNYGCAGGTWTEKPGPNEDLPINCMNWYNAFAFCIWDGGRLPTETEWNYAAAGGDEQRKYPWGSAALDDSRAIARGPTDADEVWNMIPPGLVAVGSKPDGNGRFGQADLAGSLWEWVLDKHGDYPIPCIDCALLSPDKTPQLSIRGGSLQGHPTYLRVAEARSDRYAFSTTSDLGFRCARDSQ